MRCAIYVRVSTDNEEQKTSLENQKNIFQLYVAENGWSIYDFYVDVQSGTRGNRKELQRLIADAEDKKFDLIMAKELSRIARNGELSYQIRKMVINNKIDFITLDNAINTIESNVDNYGLYAWLYEQESQRISNRLKSVFETNAKKGMFMGSIPPLGYRVENHTLHIRDDMTPDIIRRIYRNFLKGKGYDAIARELSNEGIPTPSQIAGKINAGDVWHGSTIRLILTNQNYTGDLVQGKSATKNVTIDGRDYKKPDEYIIVKNQHEPIIPRSEFDTVQQMIASRYKKRPQPKVHLFTNMAFCADCGRGMHYKKNCKGYMCGNYNKHGIKKCTDHLVRESNLKLAIIDDVRTLATNLANDTIYKKLEKQLEINKQKSEKQIASIVSDIEKLKTRKRKARDKNLDGGMSDEEFNEYIAETNQQLKELNELKYQLESSLKNNENTLAFTELKQLLDEFISFKELTPEILHRLVNRIEIKADGSPRIFYRFSNPTAYNLLLSINAQHSTCAVCGNISTG